MPEFTKAETKAIEVARKNEKPLSVELDEKVESYLNAAGSGTEATVCCKYLYQGTLSLHTNQFTCM